MGEHTPGPWEAVPEQGPAHEVVARVADYDIIRTDGQMVDEYAIDADAHLIAAAPDLLAACERILASLEEHGMVVDLDTESWDTVRAAIAKARGEQS